VFDNQGTSRSLDYEKPIQKMKNLIKQSIVSIFTLAVVVGLPLSCATAPRLEDHQPFSAREKEVLEVFNKMVEARENQDFEAYMAVFHDDAKIFKRVHPGSNNGAFLPKQQYSESPGEEFGIQPKLSDIQISFGEDIAILRCWNRYREVRSRWKLDMEKEKGEWRVIKYDYTPYRK
jgi:ketosteroid isomerase-like protein